MNWYSLMYRIHNGQIRARVIDITCLTRAPNGYFATKYSSVRANSPDEAWEKFKSHAVDGVLELTFPAMKNGKMLHKSTSIKVQ